MALITCPECGKQISDRAARCPKCGIPMQKIRSILQPLEAGSASKDADVENTHLQKQVIPTAKTPVHQTEPQLQTTNPSEALVDEKRLSEKQNEQGVLSEETQAPTVPEKAKKKRNSRTLILVIAGILLLVSGILFFQNKNSIISLQNEDVSMESTESHEDETVVKKATEEIPVAKANSNINGFEYNAYLNDLDGEFTNIRNAPNGKIIYVLYGNGSDKYYLYLSNNEGKWWRIRDNKVYDKSIGQVRYLNNNPCWIHESCFKWSSTR